MTVDSRGEGSAPGGGPSAGRLRAPHEGPKEGGRSARTAGAIPGRWEEASECGRRLRAPRAARRHLNRRLTPLPDRPPRHAAAWVRGRGPSGRPPGQAWGRGPGEAWDRAAGWVRGHAQGWGWGGVPRCGLRVGPASRGPRVAWREPPERGAGRSLRRWKAGSGAHGAAGPARRGCPSRPAAETARGGCPLRPAAGTAGEGASRPAVGTAGVGTSCPAAADRRATSRPAGCPATPGCGVGRGGRSSAVASPLPSRRLAHDRAQTRVPGHA